MIIITEETLTLKEKKWLIDYIKRAARALGLNENSQDPRLIKLKKQLLSKIASNRKKAVNESEMVRKKILSEFINKANNDEDKTSIEHNNAIIESNKKANSKKRSYLK